MLRLHANYRTGLTRVELDGHTIAHVEETEWVDNGAFVGRDKRGIVVLILITREIR